jgi:SagB-type dehydrogenase family enzyme
VNAESAPGGSGAAAREYHEGTKHSFESVRRRGHFLDWANRPYPFKIYEGISRRIRLPSSPSPTSTGPAVRMSALEALVASPAGAPGARVDLRTLARLLTLGAGVLRRRRHGPDEVIFRTYASAGALYPVEIYVACGELDDLPAGLYHFEPRAAELVLLRAGDPRPFLVRAAGSEPAVAAAPALLVLTGIPWRTAWKYTERGYRHLFWDAGMILANLLAVAASSDVAARVVLGFVDAEVEALIGLDGSREFPICLLALGTGSTVPASRDPAQPLFHEVRRLSPREPRFEAIREVNDAGRLVDEREIRAWRERAGRLTAVAAAGPAPSTEEGSHPADPPDTVVRRRGSARAFGRGTIPVGVLADILDRATRAVPADHAPGGSRLVEPYVIANAVDGLPSGAHAFRDGGFASLKEGSFRRAAGYLCLEQRLAADAAATVFLMAPLDSILEALGDRGYRAAELEGGIVGGRMYLGAYAHRFGATGLTFYDDEVVEFFSPDAAAKSCMLVVAVGESPRLRRAP